MGMLNFFLFGLYTYNGKSKTYNQVKTSKELGEDLRD